MPADPPEAGRNFGNRSSASRTLRVLRALLDWNGTKKRGLRGSLKSAAIRYLRWNRRLLLDPWLRYYPAVKILRQLGYATRGRLVDIGSGPAGLAHFLGVPVIGVDLMFSQSDLARYSAPILPVRSSATYLPFRNKTFDAVVSMDMLEHLPNQDRILAIREMLRVSKRILIVGFPFGQSSASFDLKALSEEERRGRTLNWRVEHLSQGIPGQEVHLQLLTEIHRADPNASVQWFGQEGLLGLWIRWRLQLLIPKDSRLYGLVFAPLYWVHARGQRVSGYRRIYVILTH